MRKSTWLTSGIAAVAFGFAVAAIPGTASAITFGDPCVADLTAAAGAQSGTGSYDSVCAAGGSLATLIGGFSGSRGDADNWSVMSGSYGIFDQALYLAAGAKVTFKISIAANTHEFGWTDATGTERNVLLSSTDAADPGDVVFFEPDEDPFLFYATNLTTSQTDNTFFTDRSLNSFAGVDNFMHFAILEGTFNGKIEYLIVAEDQVTGCSSSHPDITGVPGSVCGIQDDDFNDAGVHVQVVPEPATLALLGTGLLGLGLYRRRRAA